MATGASPPKSAVRTSGRPASDTICTHAVFPPLHRALTRKAPSARRLWNTAEAHAAGTASRRL